MDRHPIDSSSPLSGLQVGIVRVHNKGGECRVQLNDQAKELFVGIEDGHYMLDVAGASRPEGEEHDWAVASVTVKDGKPKLFAERLVPEFSVGDHPLVVTERLTFGPAPARAPRP